MALPQITITDGTIVADPELRYTPNGDPVANFRVACNKRRFNSQTNQWEDGEATFLNCQVWRQAAENVSKSLTKGARVTLVGELKQRSYEDKQGNQRTAFDVDVKEIGASLKFAAVQIDRNPQGGASQGNQGGWSSQGNMQPQGNAGGDPWSSSPTKSGGVDENPPF